MSTLHILWDESHLWGLLAVRAARALCIPHRVVRAADIPFLLQHEPPAMLLVPGGNARQKAKNLGAEGIAAIKKYIMQGGHYLGFCGGAGLALSATEGLGICPCGRGTFDDRLQHFMSGHLHVTTTAQTQSQPLPLPPKPSGAPQTLPVWWPGRFATQEQEGVSVLARYSHPAPDFWLADLPVANIPSEAFAIWRDVYGFSLSPSFLHGQPCIVHGHYGEGTYTLSYSHLETPDSPFANAWLSHLLLELGKLQHNAVTLPEWDLSSVADAWQDNGMQLLTSLLEDIVCTGLQHGLLFQRTPWLLGWRTGIPGMSLNNLLTMLKTLLEIPPTPAARTLWAEKKEQTVRGMALFHAGCTQYLLTERLAQTLAKPMPDVMPPAMLNKQREALFGKPMAPGGFYQELLWLLEELSFLQVQ